MELLNESTDLDLFFRRLATSSYPLLMLDYDGTLAPFREERDEAIPYSGVRDRLSRLVASVRTRTVIISGRAITDIIPLLGLPQLPEIWGSHGAERRLPDGTLQSIEISQATKAGLARIEQWISEHNIEKIVERKPAAIAFHWRGLSPTDTATYREMVLDAWSAVAGKHGLHVHEFDGGLELKAADITKAVAIHTLLHATPADTAAAYLGDDLTDEDAFEALAGHGLSVLVRKETRTTRADLRITPPEELLSFLDRWLSIAE